MAAGYRRLDASCWEPVEGPEDGDAAAWRTCVELPAGDGLLHFEADCPAVSATLLLDGVELRPAPGDNVPARWALPADGPRGERSLTLACGEGRQVPPECGLRRTGFAWFRTLSVQVHLSVDREEAALSVISELQSSASSRVAVALRVDREGLPAAETSDLFAVRPGETGLVQSLILPRPELWWPAALGGRPLYRLTAALLDAAGSVLDQRSVAFGLREARLDPAGGGVTFNGRHLPLRGWDWAAGLGPADPADLLARAVRCGATILRVRGGLESRGFYEACDRLGLPVCQELGSGFLPGSSSNTGDYPRDAGQVALQRAGEVIRLLRGHPSVMFWSRAPRSPVPEEALEESVQLEEPGGLWLRTPGEDEPREEGPLAGRPPMLIAQALRQRAEADRRAGRWPLILGTGFDLRDSALNGDRITPAVLAAACRSAAPFHVSADWRFSADTIGPRFRAEIWLHNDGPSKELLNVVIRIVDLHGRDLYQENLAAEAEAGLSAPVGDLAWRPGRAASGPMLMFIEVIDEEGECLAQTEYVLLPEEGAGLAPAGAAVVRLQEEEERLLAVNDSGRPALWVEVEAPEGAHPESGFSLAPYARRTLGRRERPAEWTLRWVNQ